jgi:hypothetical protein
MQATSIRIRYCWLPADRTGSDTDRLSSKTSRNLTIESVFEGFAIIQKSVDHELGSAILGPRSLILTHRDGSLFAVTGGVQSIGADAQIDEEIFGRFSASFAQGDVVGIRATLIAMSFDSNRYTWISAQIIALAV